MVNHSFLIFFARLTIFIVKLDRQSQKSIVLPSCFRKQNIVESQRQECACAQQMSHIKRTYVKTFILISSTKDFFFLFHYFCFNLGLKHFFSNASCFFSRLVTPIYVGLMTTFQYKISNMLYSSNQSIFGLGQTNAFCSRFAVSGYQNRTPELCEVLTDFICVKEVLAPCNIQPSFKSLLMNLDTRVDCLSLSEAWSSVYFCYVFCSLLFPKVQWLASQSLENISRLNFRCLF